MNNELPTTLYTVKCGTYVASALFSSAEGATIHAEQMQNLSRRTWEVVELTSYRLCDGDTTPVRYALRFRDRTSDGWVYGTDRTSDGRWVYSTLYDSASECVAAAMKMQEKYDDYEVSVFTVKVED